MLGIGAAVAVYLVGRAIYVPFTYDEAATWMRYVENDWLALFDFSVATNHLLNTIATRASASLFGDSPLALRLPNLLAGLAYLVTAGALARLLRDQVLSVAAFLLLVTNPYLLEFLSLSRGYGVGLAFVALATYATLRWMQQDRGAEQPLRAALAAPCVAVAATLTLLPVVAAQIGLVIARLCLRASRCRAPAASPPAWWAILATAIASLGAGVLFSALVYAAHPTLTPGLFEPIHVRVLGLLDDELEQVRVLRVDATGRQRPLEKTERGEWWTRAAHDAWGLLVDLPAWADRNLSRLDVTIGSRSFRRDRRDQGPWLVHDSDAQRVLQSTPPLAAVPPGFAKRERAINWVGAEASWRATARYAAATAAGLAGLTGIVTLLAGWLVGRGAVTSRTACVLLASLVLTASVVLAPGYLLWRDGQLYFGGTTGLIADTVTSLARGTAYGPLRDQFWPVVAAWSLAFVIAAVTTSFVFLRSSRAATLLPAIVAAITAAVVVQLVAQHHLLGTRWVVGRTALSLLFFSTLLVALASDALARLNRVARVVARLVLASLAVLSSANFVRVANVDTALDWTLDADVPTVLGVVAQLSEQRHTPEDLVIGVDPVLLPVAQYYAGRMAAPGSTITVEALPPENRAPDYAYSLHWEPTRGTLVGTLGSAGGRLWRVAAADVSPIRR